MKIPKYFYFRVRVKGNHHGKAEIEVEDASNEDVVEIVRCADCKHWTDLNGGFCDIWDQCISNAEFFCACGERGEADGRVHF